jgi:hypothetical protein
MGALEWPNEAIVASVSLKALAYLQHSHKPLQLFRIFDGIVPCTENDGRCNPVEIQRQFPARARVRLAKTPPMIHPAGSRVRRLDDLELPAADRSRLATGRREQGEIDRAARAVERDHATRRVLLDHTRRDVRPRWLPSRAAARGSCRPFCCRRPRRSRPCRPVHLAQHPRRNPPRGLLAGLGVRPCVRWKRCPNRGRKIQLITTGRRRALKNWTKELVIHSSVITPARAPSWRVRCNMTLTARFSRVSPSSSTRSGAHVGSRTLGPCTHAPNRRCVGLHPKTRTLGESPQAASFTLSGTLPSKLSAARLSTVARPIRRGWSGRSVFMVGTGVDADDHTATTATTTSSRTRDIATMFSSVKRGASPIGRLGSFMAATRARRQNEPSSPRSKPRPDTSQ